MTRFARARGSKASNERAPEDGTPWEVMKEQLEKAKKESEESKKRKEAEQQRIDNYEKFLKDQKTQKRKATWCDFPEDQPKKKSVQHDKIKSSKPSKSIDNKPDNQNEIKAATAIKPKKKKQKNKVQTEVIKPTIDTVSIKDQEKEVLLETTEPAIDSLNNLAATEQKPEKVKKKNKKIATKKAQQEDIDNSSNKSSTKINANENYNKVPTDIQNKNKPQKKKNKNFVDGQPARRKPVNDNSFHFMINGKDVKLVRFDGFPIMQKDAERLEELRKNMLQKGIPKSEIQRTIKLERRRAEKALARMKKDVCYNCRKGGHNLSDCPDLKSKIPGVDAAADGMCFKCGSTEHRQFECKVQRDKEFRFATCFICKEPGHIARQCPDNPKGLYPNGGSCKLCGDVTHLRKDCPTVMDKKEEKSIKLGTLDTIDNIEDIVQQNIQQNQVSQETSKKPKKIKF